MTNNLVKKETVAFSLPAVAQKNINAAAVAKVNEYLPEVEEKTRYFDRQNSQTTLSLMSLTMLNGQSPMRLMRQIMAEIEKRKMALAEAQVSHAKLLDKLEKLEDKTDPISEAKFRLNNVSLQSLESKINGSFKDIATLIDQYNNIKEHHKIEDWDEEAFEKEEKRHHVRRGFELVYRNLLDGGRLATSSIEYLQQYGVHPQVALTEVSKYINEVAQKISNNEVPHSNELEDFLDTMADKYYINTDKTAERLFGKSDFVNTEYMLKLENKKDDS